MATLTALPPDRRKLFACVGNPKPLHRGRSFTLNGIYRGRPIKTDGGHLGAWYDKLHAQHPDALPEWTIIENEVACLLGAFLTTPYLVAQRSQAFYRTVEEDIAAGGPIGGEALHYSERLVAPIFGGAPCYSRHFYCDPRSLYFPKPKNNTWCDGGGEKVGR